MELFHQDPCNTQGSCPSKPFEGLEQCLSWHQMAQDSSSRGYSCHYRENASSYNQEQPRGCATANHVPWLPYLRDIAFPISRWRSVRHLMSNISRIASETSDHGDSRRLASGLPACPSGTRQQEGIFRESVNQLHEITEQDPHTTDDPRAEVSLLKIEQEDKLDETRSNEAHLRHVVHQGSCPRNPELGLERCPLSQGTPYPFHTKWKETWRMER